MHNTTNQQMLSFKNLLKNQSTYFQFKNSQDENTKSTKNRNQPKPKQNRVLSSGKYQSKYFIEIQSKNRQFSQQNSTNGNW